MSKEKSASEKHERSTEASEMFNHFCSAGSLRQILGLYWNMCDTIGIRPAPLNEFYPKLKEAICSWKAQSLWRKLDTRAAHRVYNTGKAASKTRVLILGAGPCGLRSAIEAQLLGAKVVVIEKRDRISRNNVLHLWPFVIHDLKALGAKKFYGKFCAGAIDHISIRQLQCILLKVALLLGVEVHEGVTFVKEIEPADGYGWRAAVLPEEHAVSHYEFDVLVGATGKRNTLGGFQHQELRKKLAIAITANFVNKKTEAEAMAEEISGVAFIFNQAYFKELYTKTGIDLENIVYYKDETHYFVMTAKKHSLLQRGVIKRDFVQTAELLSQSNVNRQMLYDYARDAAYFATKFKIPKLEFAVNHYGQPDVSMFDFTSRYNARNSCTVTVRKNYRLLTCLVGDSLVEPFWPTGTGCAYGFLSSMDAAYAIKMFANPNNSLLATIALRESVFRLLPHVKVEHLRNTLSSYTIDPSTRYRILNKWAVTTEQVRHLLDTDDPTLLEQTSFDANALVANTTPEVPAKRKDRTTETMSLGGTLLHWLKSQLKDTDFVEELHEPSQCFTNGKVLCTLIHRYRPDLVDLDELVNFDADVCNEHAFVILQDHLGIPNVMSGQQSVSLTGVDQKLWLNYLEQICGVFRGEIPHVNHLKLDYAEFKQQQQKPPDTFVWENLGRFAGYGRATPSATVTSGATDVAVANEALVPLAAAAIRKPNYYHPIAEEERFKRARGAATSLQHDASKRVKKRRSCDKPSHNVEERTRRLQEIEANRLDRQAKRRLQRAQQRQNFSKSLHMQQANTFLRESDGSSAFEDYSLFLYRKSAPVFNDRVRELEFKLRYPDRERDLAAAYPRGVTESVDQFSDRVRSMEQRIGGKAAPVVEKKPKDLLRAIGKIDSNDWNVKEIERKIEQSKKTTDIGKSRERVPNWNREQFLARQNRLTQPQDEERYREIDSSLKAIDKQLKEGHNLDLGERGKNKVAQLAGQLQSCKQKHHSEQQQAQKSNSKALLLTASGVAEKCYFCKQRVYLMEKISAEGLTLHRSCLKCHHCHTNLRLGAYAYDRDTAEGRFYCTLHFKLPSKMLKPIDRKSLSKNSRASDPIVGHMIDATNTTDHSDATVDGMIQPVVGYLDRGTRTPERLSDDEANMEVIDENEWTDRNFGTESEESDEELSSSDESETESDSEYEETADSPLGAQTLQLAAEWISDKRFSNMLDSDADFYSYSSEDDEADSQTEGEELARAREMRRQEVTLLPPPTLPTDTETEVFSSTNPTENPVATSLVHDDTAKVDKLNSSTLSNVSACAASYVPTQNPGQLSTANIESNLDKPSPSKPAAESAEDRALKERMLKKLSVREQWLHAAGEGGSCGDSTADTGGKSKNTSFFGGLMSSLSTLIKPKAQHSSLPPTTKTVSTTAAATTSTTSSTWQASHVLESPSTTSSASLPLSVPQSLPAIATPKGTSQHTSDNTSSRNMVMAGRQSINMQTTQTSIGPVQSSPSPVYSKKHEAKVSSSLSAIASASSLHGSELELEQLILEASGAPLSSCGSQCSNPTLDTRSLRKSALTRSHSVSAADDDFLRKIKEEQVQSDKRSKKLEAKKFKSNMNSIRSAVDGGRKVVGVKSEKDVAKFFGCNQKASQQLANKDVSGLQGTASHLAKYFPDNLGAVGSDGKPTVAGSANGTPTSLSSVEGSPALGRKKPNDSDVLRYFGPNVASKDGAGGKSNAHSITLSSSLGSQDSSRKSSIESPLPLHKFSKEKGTTPKASVLLLPPKKNILAFQPTKKSKSDIVEPKKAVALQSIAQKPSHDEPNPSQKHGIISCPKVRASSDADDQLFEDLLQDVDDTLVETFETILGESMLKESSPQATSKVKSKSSDEPATPIHKQLPNDSFIGTASKSPPTASLVPKMTVKRPPFKIAMPVKMQETLEEIYLASLSKLDTLSPSSIDIIDHGALVETLESGGNVQNSSEHLGRVNEESERGELPTKSFRGVSSRHGNSDELTLHAFQPHQQQTTTTTTKTTIKKAEEAIESTPLTLKPKPTAKEMSCFSVEVQSLIAAVATSMTSSVVPAVTRMNDPPRAVPATTIPKKNITTKPRKKSPLDGTLTSSKKVTSSVEIALNHSPFSLQTDECSAKPQQASSQVQSASSNKIAHSSVATIELNQSSASGQTNSLTKRLQASDGTNLTKHGTSARSVLLASIKEDASQTISLDRVQITNEKENASISEDGATQSHIQCSSDSERLVADPPNVAIEPIITGADPIGHVAPCAVQRVYSSSEKADSVKETPTAPKLARLRIASSDEKCFEELRRKHEALFVLQDKKEETSMYGPSTLSEVRSALLLADAPKSSTPTASSIFASETKSDESIAPDYRDGINQLMMELMPGTSIEQALLDNISNPNDHQKTSFRKEFVKLKRPNSISPVGYSNNVSTSNSSTNVINDLMEPIRDVNKRNTSHSISSKTINTPTVSLVSNTDEGLGCEEKMQIRLERSAQIKELYAVRKTNVELRSERIPSLTHEKNQSSTMANVTGRIDECRRILGFHENHENQPQAEVTEFEDLLVNIDVNSANLADVDLDELLGDKDHEHSKQERAVQKKQSVNTASYQFDSNSTGSVRGTVDAKYDRISYSNSTSAKGIESQRYTVTQSVQNNATTKSSNESNVKNDSSRNPLSNNDFNVAVSQLTEKLTNLRKSPKSDHLIERKEDKKEEKENERNPEKKCSRNTSSDLISSSTVADCPMPDVISSTKKPQKVLLNDDVPKPMPMKILEYMNELKGGTSVVSQEIQVYTLHTTTGDTQEPQPSIQGMSGDYAHILKDITSGLVGADFAPPVVYEQPQREVMHQERSDFQVYKQMLANKSLRDDPRTSGATGRASPIIVTEQQPQRSLLRQKKFDRTDSTSPATLADSCAFDNSICIDPRRVRKSASIENIAIEQVFVKQKEEVVDTFFVVPEPTRQSHENDHHRGSTKLRRSKSYDRLAVPAISSYKQDSLKQKFEQLRNYDVEQSVRLRNLVDPRLRHRDLDQLGSDEELASLRDQQAGRWRSSKTGGKFLRNKSMTDVARCGRKETVGVELPKVDIDRESPRPRMTDFSKWEAILDKGITYYEGGPMPKADIKSLEKRVEDLEIRRAQPLRRKTIPTEYDPEEYVPRISRRGADLCELDPALSRGFDHREYVSKPIRGLTVQTLHPADPLPRSYDPEEYIPKANRREPACYEIPVSIQNSPVKHLREKPYRYLQHHIEETASVGAAAGARSAPLGRSKTSVNLKMASREAYDLPARDIARSQYSRRYDAENRNIVDRSHRLHEKTNKFIRTQLTHNDPNPYIREMLEHDSENEDTHIVYPAVSASSSGAHFPRHYQRAGVIPVSTGASVSSSHGSGSAYSTMGSTAMSRIQTKAIMQPSRMLQYTNRGKDYPVTKPSAPGSSADARTTQYHRRRGDGETSRTHEKCNIS